MKDFWERGIPVSKDGYPICNRCKKEIKDPEMVVIEQLQVAYCLDCIDGMKEFNMAANVE